MPIAYPFVIMLIAEKGEDKQEFVVKLDAYEPSHCTYQALTEIEAQHGLAAKGYNYKLISITPDNEKAQDRLTSVMSALTLLAMPTTKGKS